MAGAPQLVCRDHSAVDVRVARHACYARSRWWRDLERRSTIRGRPKPKAAGGRAHEPYLSLSGLDTTLATACGPPALTSPVSTPLRPWNKADKRRYTHNLIAEQRCASGSGERTRAF